MWGEMAMDETLFSVVASTALPKQPHVGKKKKLIN